jgi:hypothetical protein
MRFSGYPVRNIMVRRNRKTMRHRIKSFSDPWSQEKLPEVIVIVCLKRFHGR